MRYRIGEMADLFGMTKEGLRYLERQGIIRSRRDERNGYRYFPRTEITRLKEIRSYQALGFSLEEAQRIVCQTPRGQLHEQLVRKQEELTQMQERLNRMQILLAKQCDLIRSAQNETHFQLVMRPELLFFNRVMDEESGRSREEREHIACARAVEKIWIRSMPPVGLWGKHCDAQGHWVKDVYGSGAAVEVVKALGLPVLEEMVHLEPCLCVRAMLEAPDTDESPLGDPTQIISRVREEGYTICGDTYSTLRLHFTGENGKRWSIFEMYIPVCEKDNGNLLTVK